MNSSASVELPLARRLVDDADELAAVAADPAAAVEAGPEIGADAELADALEQRLLHAQLAAELDEGGDAVAQQLGDRELRIEPQLLRRRVVVGADIARIAADPRALARDADLQERLAEIVAAPDVGNQPVRGAVARMHVGVDEARRDELVARVDLAIDRAVEALADEQHGVAFDTPARRCATACDAPSACPTSQPQEMRVRMNSTCLLGSIRPPPVPAGGRGVKPLKGTARTGRACAGANVRARRHRRSARVHLRADAAQRRS